MLVKQRDGTLEEDNFLLTSRIDENLGNVNYSRTLSEFILKEGEFQRNFLHEEFVLILKFEDFTEDGGEFYCYVSNEVGNVVGAKVTTDEVDEAYRWIKLIYYDGYLEVYTSSDKVNWVNSGGEYINDIAYQHLKYSGNDSISIIEYAVYKNPYLTVLNYDEGYTAVLKDSDDTIIDQSLFDENRIAQLYLNYCLEGTLEIYSDEDELIYTSDLINFKYGDIYLESSLDIELRYKDESMSGDTSHLDSLYEALELVNNSDNTYDSVTIRVNKNDDNADVISLTTDEENFSESITFENVEPGVVYSFKVKIEKSEESVVYCTRKFDLEVY